MGMLRQMTARDGDTVVTWGNTEVEGATKLSEAEVKERFDKIVAGATDVFAVRMGQAPEKVKTFDPNEAELVAVPNLVAG